VNPAQNSNLNTLPGEPELVDLERCAVRLARAAGAHILAVAESRAFAVHFKPPFAGHAPNSNLVSDVDRDVEAAIRAELAARYPDHAVIGEEGGADALSGARIVWAVDPVDGTTNFVNGLPLVASSIGVLYEGLPIAGAIWCGATHALRPGIYHARLGGALCFDDTPLERRPAAPWRRLVAEPGGANRLGERWDRRVLGSATLELAFTAAGLTELAQLSRPSLWDVAAGLVLLRAAGCAALAYEEAGWHPLEAFAGDFAHWSRPMLAGDESALQDAVRILSR
jgi:myo-inositol-1(or 4)-monophosphatase